MAPTWLKSYALEFGRKGAPPAAKEFSRGTQGGTRSSGISETCADDGLNEQTSLPAPNQEDAELPPGLLNEEDTPLGEGKPGHDAARKRTKSYINMGVEAVEFPEVWMNSPHRPSPTADASQQIRRSCRAKKAPAWLESYALFGGRKGGPPAAEECSLGSQGNSSGISETCADDGLHEQTSLPVLTQEDGDPPAALLSEEDTPLGEGKPAHDAALTNSYPNLDAEAADKLENAMKSLQPIPGLLEPASPPPRQRGVYVLSAYSAHAPVRRPPQGQPALGDGISSSTLLRRQAMGKVAPFPAAGGGRKRAAASRKPLAAAAVPQKRQRVEAVPAGSHGPPAGPTFTSWQRTDAPLTRSRTMCNGSDAPATSP